MNPRTFAAAGLAALALSFFPSPAGADSISYVKDGDVWLSTSDGARQHRVTATGGYEYASQADDGTLIALTGRRLHRLSPTGALLADFATPVSFSSGPNQSTFYGPFDPQISPDGTKVAYTYYWQYYGYDYSCSCMKQRLEGGTAYSYADRLTGWDETGLGRQSGWRWASWIGNGQTLLSEPTVSFGNEDVIVDTLGDGTSTVQRWFSDTGARGLNDGEMSLQRTKMAFVGTDPNTVASAPIDNQVRVYRMVGQAPAVPQICFWFADPSGQIDGPSFSPDGSALAWSSTRGIEVGLVPSFANGCAVPQQGGVVLIPGGRYPDWGPADVPPPTQETPPPTQETPPPVEETPPPVEETPPPVGSGGGAGSGGTGSGSGGTGSGTIIPGPGPGDGGAPDPGTSGSALAVRAQAARIAQALRSGLRLTVVAGTPGRLAATAFLGKIKVASGGGQSAGHAATALNLALTAKGRRALKRRGASALRVVVTLRPADGSAVRRATVRAILRR